MKNIVIIGGSHGVSQSVAQKLESQARLYCFSRERGQHGEWCAFDASKDSLPVDALPEEIHGVVYAPGSINLRPFHLLKDEDFQTEWELNALGAVRVLRALYPRLKKSGKASVVLFSTVAVKRGMPFHASIAMAKGAIEGLTRSLGAEWAPAIRVNAVAPSLTETPLAEKLTANAKILEQSVEKHPLKRIGTPGEVAAAAVFLLSDDAAWVTGQILAVDGGMSL